MNSFKTKFSILFSLIIGFCILNSCAQQLDVKENTLLYKIEGDGIQDSYLYGTFHILPKKDFLLKDKVKKAFENCEQLVLELDMDDPTLGEAMAKHMNMKGDDTIKSLMKKKDYEALDEELLEVVGTGIAAFERTKPFMISSMLVNGLIGEESASFEGTFLEMAASKNMEVLGLEEVEEQMNIFDVIPYQDQIEGVLEMLYKEEEMAKLLQEMITYYAEENTQALYEVFEDYFHGEEALKKLMLDSRNKNWIPKIGALAKDQKVFFGVGAGHLAGKNGVVNLLRKAGYTLTPIY